MRSTVEPASDSKLDLRQSRLEQRFRFMIPDKMVILEDHISNRSKDHALISMDCNHNFVSRRTDDAIIAHLKGMPVVSPSAHLDRRITTSFLLDQEVEVFYATSTIDFNPNHLSSHRPDNSISTPWSMSLSDVSTSSACLFSLGVPWQIPGVISALTYPQIELYDNDWLP
jgi:hypothetical protein